LASARSADKAKSWGGKPHGDSGAATSTLSGMAHSASRAAQRPEASRAPRGNATVAQHRSGPAFLGVAGDRAEVAIGTRVEAVRLRARELMEATFSHVRLFSAQVLGALCFSVSVSPSEELDAIHLLQTMNIEGRREVPEAPRLGSSRPIGQLYLGTARATGDANRYKHCWKACVLFAPPRWALLGRDLGGRLPPGGAAPGQASGGKFGVRIKTRAGWRRPSRPSATEQRASPPGGPTPRRQPPPRRPVRHRGPRGPLVCPSRSCPPHRLNQGAGPASPRPPAPG